MLRSKISNFFLVFIFLASNVLANSYLRQEFLKEIQYGCLIEEKTVVFCTDQNITDPHLIIRLPMLEPVVLANGVHAFRVMATLENNTGYNLSGASVRVFFGAEPGQLLDVSHFRKNYLQGNFNNRKITLNTI